MKNFQNSAVKRFLQYFEGEEPPVVPPADPVVPPPTAKPVPPKQLTAAEQAAVDAALRQQRDRTREELATLSKQLQSLQGVSAEKDELVQKIEILQQTYRTQEEQQKHEFKSQKAKLETDLTTAQAEANAWKSRYTTERVEIDIRGAATSTDIEAFDADQIVDLLRNRSELVDELDETGKKTGRLVTKIKLKLPDSTGKEIDLVLPPNEALKRMKELPKYGNLFKSGAVGGPGLGKGGKNTPINIGELAKNPEAYRKADAAGQI